MGDIMKIKKYKKISDGKYRLELDNGTILDVYEDVIIKNNLLYKKEVDIELLNEIEKDNEYQNAFNMSLKYITVRLRSINEIENYLKKKNIGQEVIDNTIEKLKKNNYLNDEIFTKAFIKDKINFTTMGKYKIINELKKLKVSDEIIYNLINEVNDDIWNERIDKLVNKYIKSKNKYSGNVLKNKLYIYLVNLGYDKSLVVNKLNYYDF